MFQECAKEKYSKGSGQKGLMVIFEVANHPEQRPFVCPPGTRFAERLGSPDAVPTDMIADDPAGIYPAALGTHGGSDGTASVETPGALIGCQAVETAIIRADNTISSTARIEKRPASHTPSGKKHRIDGGEDLPPERKSVGIATSIRHRNRSMYQFWILDFEI